jgi:hypothetical protein
MNAASTLISFSPSSWRLPPSLVFLLAKEHKRVVRPHCFPDARVVSPAYLALVGHRLLTRKRAETSSTVRPNLFCLPSPQFFLSFSLGTTKHLVNPLMLVFYSFCRSKRTALIAAYLIAHFLFLGHRCVTPVSLVDDLNEFGYLFRCWLLPLSENALTQRIEGIRQLIHRACPKRRS